MDIGILIGMIMGGIFMYMVFGLLWFLLTAIARWTVFSKAGEAGWKAFIPFYSDYTLYKMVWNVNYYWVSLVAILIPSALKRVENGGMLVDLLTTVCSLVGIVLTAMICGKLAKAFGKGMGFAIGLFFLTPLFTMILAFGSARYLGVPEKEGFEERFENKVDDFVNRRP